MGRTKSPVDALRAFNAQHAKPRPSPAEAGIRAPAAVGVRWWPIPDWPTVYALVPAENEIQEHLARIWKEREEREIAREPSLAQIPRILLRKAPGPAQSSLPQELGRQARARLRERMSSLVLQHSELEHMWGLLKGHASPPHQPSAHFRRLASSAPGCGTAVRPLPRRPSLPAADERINWDDFTQIAEQMPERAAECFFGAKHFVLFELDAYGRIPIVLRLVEGALRPAGRQRLLRQPGASSGSGRSHAPQSAA